MRLLLTSFTHIPRPCTSAKSVRLLERAALHTRTRAHTAAVTRLATLATRSYSTEPSNNPSKFAQALQSQNKSALDSVTSYTPSAAQALGLAADTTTEMAPPRRAQKAGAKPNVGKDGKPISDVPRPSASILLISPANEILLLHRVKTSSSFASAHVFPGGNLSSKQDGEIPAPDSPERHKDSEVYRIGAIRECFEESGILLARDQQENMLCIEESEKEEARTAIHANKLNFVDWVKSKGGKLDTEALIPFTRWVTPIGVPRRFTTQMYIYFWPLTSSSTSSSLLSGQAAAEILVPTSDGGKEHTEAVFRSCQEWTARGSKGEVILFPPQYYLMHQLARFLTNATTATSELEAQRTAAKKFLAGTGGNDVTWAEKCISPQTLGLFQGRAVLDLSKPGPELKDSGRKGESGDVVLVKFSKAGPREVEVKRRSEVLEGMRVEAKAKEAAKL